MHARRLLIGGLGREGVRFAMEELTEIKIAVIRLPGG